VAWLDNCSGRVSPGPKVETSQLAPDASTEYGVSGFGETDGAASGIRCPVQTVVCLVKPGGHS